MNYDRYWLRWYFTEKKQVVATIVSVNASLCISNNDLLNVTTMKFVPSSLLLAGILSIVLFGCNKDTKDGTLMTKKGTLIDKSNVSGCGYLIRLEDGSYLYPSDFENKSFVFINGMPVNVSYQVLSEPSDCSMGSPAKIVEIMSDGCNVIEALPDLGSAVNHPLTEADDILLNGDNLSLTAKFAGGCENHTMRLIWLGSCCDTVLVQPYELYLLHDNNGDACEALISTTPCWSLLSLRHSSVDSIAINLNYFDHTGLKTKPLMYRYQQ